MQSYDLLIERIVKSSGLEKSEVEKRVEAKKAKLSGLISKEGAAQIIAAELGISFENQDVKVSELMPGMKGVNIFGKVINVFPVREFERNGRQGKVMNLVVADETGSLRIVLWDTNHIDLIENGKVQVGDVVEIKNGSVRDGEVHLSSFAELKKSDRKIDSVNTSRAVVEKSISELQNGQNVKLRALVVQVFNPRFYSVCPECKKKVTAQGEGFVCQEHGSVSPKEKAILNFVIDDGSETMRLVMFSDQINKLVAEESLKEPAQFEIFKEDILGTEIKVSGNVRTNAFFNNLELIASDVEKIDVEKLIEELEKK